MCHQLDRVLASHCAPALAGIKPANLVSCAKRVCPALERELIDYNQHLNQSGIHLEILCQSAERYLLLVYRPQKLRDHLEQPRQRALLERRGYRPQAPLEELLLQLKGRMRWQQFPHEIGLFLGYPPEDVEGFQEHQGKNYLLSGYWKVYGDVTEARQRFARYDRCKRVVSEKVRSGMAITQLFGKRQVTQNKGGHLLGFPAESHSYCTTI